MERGVRPIIIEVSWRRQQLTGGSHVGSTSSRRAATWAAAEPVSTASSAAALWFLTVELVAVGASVAEP